MSWCLLRPDRPVALRADYGVVDVEHREAAALVALHHYAAGAANTSTARHGLRRRGELVGATLWMPPTARAARGLAAEHLGDHERHREVLVLSRLVVVPGEPQNAASILLAASTRAVWLDPRWTLLVTYADKAEGHEGTIYKATGWTPAGETVPTPRWLLNGRLVAPKATKNRTVAEMKALGAVRTWSVKLRFVQVRRRPLRSKRAWSGARELVLF